MINTKKTDPSGLLYMRLGGARALRNWLPPILFDFLAKLVGTRISVYGNFRSWEAAASLSRGYEAQDILERVRKATQLVVEDRSKFERDGVVISKKEFPFVLIAALLDASQRNGGKLSVMDFGGSLGSSYFQCRDFLEPLNNLRWSVIEQAHFVECGKAQFQNSVLKFYRNIEECYQFENPNVVLFSSVLQYVEDVDIILQDVASRMPDTIIIDRTPFVNDYTRIAVQNVPKSIGKASYPIRLFAYEDLTKYFRSGYNLVARFESPDPPIFYRGKLVTFEGIIFQKTGEDNR